jgi:hypothetical protein
MNSPVLNLRGGEYRHLYTLLHGNSENMRILKIFKTL